jgi:nucleoside-diphosphate-sugar epimerase
LLEAAPESVALRASIVIGARSRSFRFLVRLIERLPVLAVPAWRHNRTQPIDGRDVLEFLAAAATLPEGDAGRSWDIAGPDAMSYAEMLERIADSMMINRVSLGLNFSLTPVASVVAAAVAGEEVALIGPLMESLEHDLLPRDQTAAGAFGVKLHRFDASVERALRELEALEEVSAR